MAGSQEWWCQLIPFLVYWFYRGVRHYRCSLTWFGIFRESWLDSWIPGLIPWFLNRFLWFLFTKLGNTYHVSNNIRRNTNFYKNINQSFDSWFQNLDSHWRDSESCRTPRLHLILLLWYEARYEVYTAIIVMVKPVNPVMYRSNGCRRAAEVL